MSELVRQRAIHLARIGPAFGASLSVQGGQELKSSEGFRGKTQLGIWNLQ
jgi:hypothetical protein